MFEAPKLARTVRVKLDNSISQKDIDNLGQRTYVLLCLHLIVDSLASVLINNIIPIAVINWFGRCWVVFVVKSFCAARPIMHRTGRLEYLER